MVSPRFRGQLAPCFECTNDVRIDRHGPRVARLLPIHVDNAVGQVQTAPREGWHVLKGLLVVRDRAWHRFDFAAQGFLTAPAGARAKPDHTPQPKLYPLPPAHLHSLVSLAPFTPPSLPS